MAGAIPLIGPDVRRRIPLVVALQLAVALTEGVGLVLLVPLLALSGHGRSTIPDRFGSLFAGADLATMLTVFVALVAVRAILVLLRTRVTLALELALVDGLRRAAWHALLRADWRMLAGLRRSDQASMLISNLDRVGFGINQLLAATTTLATLMALGLAALAIAPLFALAAAAGGVLVLLAYRNLHRRATRLGSRQSEAWNRIHGTLGEALGALRAIKGQRREEHAEQAVMDSFADLGRARVAFMQGSGIGQLALQVAGAMLLAWLVWLGMARWGLSAVTILPMVALFARGVPLLDALQSAWQQWLHARPALAAAQAMIADLTAAQEPVVPPGPVPRLGRAIGLDDVGVQFAGQTAPALDSVTLTIPAGATVALTGPSGAGKSTLADLLAGLIAPDRGQVLLDGQVLDPARQRAWRGAVAYVEQDPLVLAASLRENLSWGTEGATDPRMWSALEAAAAADFVRSWPEGLDTRLGDGGRLLSGGERQRLMLARALLRDPQLLILDEATSALDADNEAAIAAALGRLRGRMTIVLIAHRGALLDLADRVIRLERGRVVDES